MSENVNLKQNTFYNTPFLNFRGTNSDEQNPDLNIKAHNSSDMKVHRTRKTVNDTPKNIPIHQLITPQEMDNRLKSVNTDIFESVRKEKAKHDFDSKLYFKIFGGVALSTAIIACIRKFRK